MQRALNTDWAELVITKHANAARDEMKQLAIEFRILGQVSCVPTPALNRLYSLEKVNDALP